MKDFEPIDNGFLHVTAATARRLTNGLPSPGHEKIVQHDGHTWWLARTVVDGKQVWSIRRTAWRKLGDCAVL